MRQVGGIRHLACTVLLFVVVRGAVDVVKSLSGPDRRPVVGIRLDRDQLRRLDEAAGAVGFTRPQAIREAVDAWCRAAKKAPRRDVPGAKEVPVVPNPVDLQKARAALSDISFIRRSLSANDADVAALAALDSAYGVFYRLLEEVCVRRGQDPRELERGVRPSELEKTAPAP